MARMGRREGWVCALGGALYALFAAFGWQMESAGQSDPPRALLVAALLWAPFALLLAFSFARAERRPAAPAGKPFDARRAFALIFLCAVPMALIAFPGSFAYDVPFQLEQVFTGAYSTHHPLLHTLLLGGCVALGRALGCINAGAALYTLVQMLGMALCFTAACASVARFAGARAARRCALWFALYPLHWMMAVNATKDVLFSGLFALTLALLTEAVLTRPPVRVMVALAVCGGLMLTLRNNAVYAWGVWLALAVLTLRRGCGRMLTACAAALALGMGLCALLASVTRAVPGDKREMLSWPIQQLARARVMEADKLTDEEKQVIDALMPDQVWQQYDPMISDPVKFGFDTAALMDDLPRALRVYLQVGAKCPQTYADAVGMLTYPFWYPYSRYSVPGYYLQMGITTDYYDWCDFARIESRSLLPRVLASLTWRFGAQGAMQIPILGWAFNTGLLIWAMFYGVLREAYAGRWRRFAVDLLPVLLWGTFLLGPVMAGRYVYPFVCALPVLFARVRETAA